MARTKVTQDMIIEMNELYIQLKTYAAVSRAMGGTPSATTVKKYIIPNYIPKARLNVKVFDKELPKFNPKMFLRHENWGWFCTLSDEEKAELTELWEEISI